jgi:hypothetical protein
MATKPAKKQTAKQLLRHMAQRYEQLYFELWTMQAVVIAQKDPSLLEKCANALDSKEGRQIVKDRFAAVQKEFASRTDEEVDWDALLARIPPTPTIN